MSDIYAENHQKDPPGDLNESDVLIGLRMSVANDGGKRYRLFCTFPDGRSFELRPEGEITAREAHALCLLIASRLY